ncbi:RCE2 [Symbiodinium pilosum]|uniref:RCE2 protein n=1 Tax=Symbiodinium pilosum TaxID=2952 RepID=A0A812WEJ4_SYMPI|nr:RCE2 [Symbiodinium pilosum]
MIKIFGVGRGKRAEESKDGDDAEAPAAKKKQPGEIRMQKELDEMELPPQCHINFPDKNNLMHFQMQISPDEGFWKGASYTFVFNVAPLYPHEAPKVKCHELSRALTELRVCRGHASAFAALRDVQERKKGRLAQACCVAREPV